MRGNERNLCCDRRVRSGSLRPSGELEPLVQGGVTAHRRRHQKTVAFAQDALDVAGADVWPLNPKGEVFVILMMEDTRGIEALPEILKKVPGIGAILIGEGDLSQELGYPRQYEHPEVLKWMARVVDTCKQHNVVVGHPHVDASNVERILAEGYRFLMAAPVRSYAALDKGLKLAGRA